MNPSTANRYTDMNPKDIKIALLRAGITQKAIAQSIDPPVSRQAVHLVVHNKATSHRIRVAVAKAIGIDLKRIWPSVYLGGRKGRKQSQISIFIDE